MGCKLHCVTYATDTNVAFPTENTAVYVPGTVYAQPENDAVEFAIVHEDDDDNHADTAFDAFANVPFNHELDMDDDAVDGGDDAHDTPTTDGDSIVPLSPLKATDSVGE